MLFNLGLLNTPGETYFSVYHLYLGGRGYVSYSVQELSHHCVLLVNDLSKENGLVLFPETSILGRNLVSNLLSFFHRKTVLFRCSQNITIFLNSLVGYLKILIVGDPFLSATLALGFFLTLFVLLL